MGWACGRLDMEGLERCLRTRSTAHDQADAHPAIPGRQIVAGLRVADRPPVLAVHRGFEAKRPGLASGGPEVEGCGF